MRSPLFAWLVSLLFGFHVAVGQSKTWLTDEQARETAGAAVHSVYPHPCYSTYRKESLEDLALGVRTNPIVGDHLNNSIYIYRVASDVCEYVVAKDGKQIFMSQVSMDCCDYGSVAVDRVTAKTFWFGGKEKPADIFKEFVRDEQLHPDSSRPTLFIALYLNLVWGERGSQEITSLGQLRDLVQGNFQSAYSPYERDNRWQRKFDRWWHKFRTRMRQLKLETTYEPASGETVVRGYGFSGFELTVPRTDGPPTGTPKVFQWALLVKPDGTIEQRPSAIIYSSR